MEPCEEESTILEETTTYTKQQEHEGVATHLPSCGNTTTQNHGEDLHAQNKFFENLDGNEWRSEKTEEEKKEFFENSDEKSEKTADEKKERGGSKQAKSQVMESSLVK